MRRQVLVTCLAAFLMLAVLSCGAIESLLPQEAAAPPPAGEEEKVPESDEVAPSPQPTSEPAPTEVPPTPTPAPLHVLLVAEDYLSGRSDFTSSDEIAASLDLLDVNYDTWSTYNDDVPSPSTLDSYNVVIWSVGDDCCDSPPFSSVVTIIDYLDGGGRLLIEGGSVTYIWTEHPFVTDYLGVATTDFSPVGDLLVANPNHPLAQGFPDQAIALSVTGIEPPDVIQGTLAETVFIRGRNSAAAGTSAITAHDSGQFKVVFSAVPLQWFSSSDRELLLGNALDWLAAPSLGSA